MKAVVFGEFGSPRKVLQVVERPLPEPGPGQVRVKMVLSPLHNHDLMIITGHYGFKPDLPHAPGTEALGLVDKLGEGVTNLAVGQRVTGGASAAWAEYYLGNAASLVQVPENVDDATACQLVSMPLSAWRLLGELELEAGDWIVQNAANGAVGKIIAELAAERGVRVLNIVRREAAVAELAAEGIGDAVSTEHDDWQERARAITGGAPIRRALDSVAGRAADELMDLVADEGWLISFGALSGRPVQLNPDNLLFKRATVKGFWAAKPSTFHTPEQIRGALIEFVQKAARGELRLPIAQTFPLDQAAEAAEASNEKGRKGKIALRGV
jgi:NADPH:quinone reductase-like Zn-dependent oxidoreductase